LSENASDVIVVGSGAAAMMASMRSVLGGAKVTVLEASDLFGGTSALSGGGMWLPRNHRAVEAGVKDSREAVKEYLTRLTNGVSDEKVIDAYIDTAPIVLQYIEANTALEFYADLERPDIKALLPGAVTFGRLVAPKLYELSRLGDLLPKLRQPDWEIRIKKGGGRGSGMEAVTQQEIGQYEAAGDPKGWVELARQRVADGIVPRGCALVASMLEVVAAKGGTLLTNARARELVMDGDRVTGVIAEVDGRRQTFTASAGVVLAAGGFEWNKELWSGLVRVPDANPLSPPYNRGDALLMAQKAGARLALLDQVWWAAGGGAMPGQIAVNRAGRRFCNENLAYDFGKMLQVFDPHKYEYPNIPAYVISNHPLSLRDSDIDALGKQVANRDSGFADTLRDLADQIGVDPDGLEATVAEFDRNAAKGVDPEFDRGKSPFDHWRKFDTSLPNAALGPVGTKGPFYAQRIAANLFGTKGGPVIDEHARIVDFQGAPIPGLHGAGNSVASPFGLAYPGGGGSLGPGVTFGYLAGEYLTAS
jgi:glycine/D-amino acid oxidase-like deaminating enzyme